ncbi:MAG: serine/threonine protein kinase, partial [Planctomycetes bacterium]|nr:serine/threonine protein kinase [Planctomycetota bacterium]
MAPTEPSKDDLFAQAARAQGAVSPARLEECLALRRAAPAGPDLVALLVARGDLDAERAADLRRAAETAFERSYQQTAVVAPPPGAAPAGAPGARPGAAVTLPAAGSGGSGGAVPIDRAERVLAGDYRILRFIGRGGMGTVYLAEQLSLKRRVALKLLPREATSAPEALARFRREAQAAARLQHPGIVQVFALHEDRDEACSGRAFLAGAALGRRRRRGGRLPIEEALRTARDAARALAAAHRNGVIHRDVKPDNLFIQADGSVKLGDFGLARDLAGDPQLSSAGQIMGTADYMSPEQAQGR